MYTFETGGGNEPETFMLELTGKETSSSEKLLQSIKVYEGKCEDETRISSLFGTSCFTMKASRATFDTYATIHGVRIVP
jgi:hypothetical protein